jgi:hypothetical protein
MDEAMIQLSYEKHLIIEATVTMTIFTLYQKKK